MPFLNISYNETPLSTAPASVERAMFSDQFVFNGIDELTGFTNDIFGNAHNSSVVGAPLKGPNGGFIISEATASDNYVVTNLAELNVAYPSDKVLYMVYIKTVLADTAGILVGGDTSTKYLGASEQGVTGTESLESGSRTQSYRARGSSNLPTPPRDDLYNLVYSDTNVISVAMIGATIVDGLCHWGRYDPAFTGFHTEIEVMGYGVTNSKVLADVDGVNTWVEQWA